MGSLKLPRWFSFIILFSILLNACARNATPTFTVESPTAVVIEPSITPEPVTTEIESHPGAEGAGDSLYPNLGNGGYDVQHYTLDLTVNDVATSDLTGKTIIEAQATQNLRSFNLDFIGFEITTITVNGQPAEFERNKQELTVTPSTPLAEGESFTVEVQYQGSPGEMDSM